MMEFFNMSFSLLIASFAGLNELFITYADYVIPPKEKYYWYDSQWYHDVGNIIAATALTGNFIQNGMDFKKYAKKTIKQF
jgi:hypothetical protein